MFSRVHFSFMEQAAKIAKLGWFAGLPPVIRDALTASGRVQRRAAGEWLYGEGDEDTGLVAVLEGGLYLYSEAPNGAEVLFGMLPRGSVMGQSILFGGGPRLVTAVCAADSVLYLLPDHVLRTAGHKHPALWTHLSELVYGQLRAAMRGTVDFIALAPRERVVSRLLTLSNFGAEIPVTQSALAEMIGASRHAVNGWLRELEEKRLIARHYGKIEVLDRRALQRRLRQA